MKYIYWNNMAKEIMNCDQGRVVKPQIQYSKE